MLVKACQRTESSWGLIVPLTVAVVEPISRDSADRQVRWGARLRRGEFVRGVVLRRPLAVLTPTRRTFQLTLPSRLVAL